MFLKLELASLLVWATLTLATIGPTSTLTIANKNISPDGFTRAYVEETPFPQNDERIDKVCLVHRS